MINKEEIEKAKRCFEDELHFEKITYNCVNHYRQIIIDNHIVLYKYIQQLESREQKLIEKLEEDKIELTEELKYNITKREARIQLNLIDKYLEILK